MKTVLANTLACSSVVISFAAVSVAWALPTNCHCGTGTPCNTTTCLKACYGCCTSNCTDSSCCQDWCDGRGLTCNETPGGPNA